MIVDQPIGFAENQEHINILYLVSIILGGVWWAMKVRNFDLAFVGCIHTQARFDTTVPNSVEILVALKAMEIWALPRKRQYFANPRHRPRAKKHTGNGE